MIPKSEAIEQLNRLGKSSTPFQFYCDFLGENWVIQELGSKKLFQFQVQEMKNSKSETEAIHHKVLAENTLQKNEIPFSAFENAFNQVIREINFGNSFLTNLTFKTPISSELSLEEIFRKTAAKYKLLTDSFVVFSPETFIRTVENKVYAYPMKGTIDASIPNAEQIIMEDVKEIAEHVTIVDLIRNDLSQIAFKVKVKKFRFIDHIHSSEKDLLQVSSEIEGSLPSNWQQQIGSILAKILPAGSISGAPKPETLKIIQANESYERGFYTGICGQFDGTDLDTGVMIRFIKKEENQLSYCSGGGITSFSKAESEYQEMIDKIYLPL